MSYWATKRKILYLGIPLFVIFIIITTSFFFLFYKAPTCFDNKQNGNETGVDCGGSCSILCPSDNLSPIILWSRAFRVTGNVFNMIAYVENPNISSSAYDIPYVFVIKDSNNKIIATREGKTFIPKNKIFAVFDGPMDFGTSTPSKVEFSFTKSPVWYKDTEAILDIVVRNKALTQEEKSPRIDVSIQNNTVNSISNIEAVAIVYEDKNKAIGASRTFVNNIDPDKSVGVVFTWPKPFETGVESCEIPADIMIAIDRSGSMSDISKNPPQPLTDVKNAAVSFVNQLKKNDQVGVVSFSTNVSSPIDMTLSDDFVEVTKIINSISIGVSGPQNTNIGDALVSAMNELLSPRHKNKSNSIIVLLTDGVATDPEKSDDKKYPENYATEKSVLAKQAGVQIFTIGLGKNINANFLKLLASNPENYFSAPTTADLQSIYSKIANAICKKSPKIIEIITRVVPSMQR